MGQPLAWCWPSAAALVLVPAISGLVRTWQEECLQAAGGHAHGRQRRQRTKSTLSCVVMETGPEKLRLLPTLSCVAMETGPEKLRLLPMGCIR